MLPWDKTQPGRPVAPRCELRAITDGGHQSRRGNHTHTRNGRSAVARLLGTMPCLPFALQLPDGRLHRLKLGEEATQSFAGTHRETGIIRVFNHHHEISDARGPLAGGAPQLTAMPSDGIEEHRAWFDQELS
jgi:hypothetical protein